MFRALVEKKIVIIHGKSGCGKTSLINAGLVPLLQQQTNIDGEPAWRMSLLQTEDRPLPQLFSALSSLAGDQSPKKKTAMGRETDLDAVISRLDSLLSQNADTGPSIFLVIDSFEHFLSDTGEKEPDKETALRAVSELIRRNGPSFHLLISVREDFFEEVVDFVGPLGISSDFYFELSFPSRSRLRQIIEKPFHQGDRKLSVDIVEELISSVEDQLYPLSQLQYMLSYLWAELGAAAGEMDADDIFEEQIRGAGFLSRRADSVYAAIPPGDQRIVRELFLSFLLVDRKGRILCRQLYLNQLSYLLDARVGEISSVIDQFYSGGRAFLKATDIPEKNDISIEVSHQAFFFLWEHCHQWVEWLVEQHRIYQELAEDLEREKKGSKVEWSAEKVREAVHWLEGAMENEFFLRNRLSGFDTVAAFILKRSLPLAHSKMPAREIKKRQVNKTWYYYFLPAVGILVAAVVYLLLFFPDGVRNNNPELDSREVLPATETVIGDTISDSPDSVLVPENTGKPGGIAKEKYRNPTISDTSVILNEEPAPYRSRPGSDSLAGTSTAPSKLSSKPKSPQKQIFTASKDSLAERYWNLATLAMDRGDRLTALHFVAYCAQASDDSAVINRCVNALLRLNRNIGLIFRVRLPYTMYGATLSGDGSLLASWGAGGNLQIWDTANPFGRAIKIPVRGEVWNVMFSPNGAKILTVGSDQSVHLWKVNDGSPAMRPLRHAGEVKGATFNSDGRLILSWSSDGIARLWHTVNGTPAYPPMEHDKPVVNAFFSQKEKYLMTITSDGQAHLWRIGSEKLVRRDLKPAEDDAFFAGGTFSAGDQFAMAWSGQQIDVWNTGDGLPQGPPKKSEYGLIRGACFSPDASYLLSWDGFRFAGLWDVKNAFKLPHWMQHQSAVLGGCFSPDCKYILTWSEEGFARLWRMPVCEPVNAPLSGQSNIVAGQFESSGRWILTAGSDGASQLWTGKGKAAAPPMLLPGAVTAASFCRKENAILTWSRDANQADVWYFSSGAALNGNDANSGLIAEYNRLSPKEWPLFVQLSTGTILTATGKLAILTPQDWLKTRATFAQFANR